MQCISDRVRTCLIYPSAQLPELSTLCFWVVTITMEMKVITARVCIMLGNLWRTFIHTSSLPQENPMRRKAEVSWSVQSDAERMSTVTQGSSLWTKASVLADMSQLFSVKIWRVLCSHKTIYSNKFPFPGPHAAALLYLYLFWYVVFLSYRDSNSVIWPSL